MVILLLGTMSTPSQTETFGGFELFPYIILISIFSQIYTCVMCDDDHIHNSLEMFHMINIQIECLCVFYIEKFICINSGVASVSD